MIRPLAIAALLALGIAPALAGPRVTLPPVAYDHEPPRGSYSIYWAAEVWELQLLCGNATELACSDVKLREVYVLAKYRGTPVGAKLLRHEKGHLNGWAGNHPGWRKD